MLETSSKVSSKGQVVIPVEIRKKLNIEEGDTLKFNVDEQNEVKLEIIKRNSILDLFGSVQAKGDTSDFEKVRHEARENWIEQRQRKTES